MEEEKRGWFRIGLVNEGSFEEEKGRSLSELGNEREERSSMIDSWALGLCGSDSRVSKGTREEIGRAHV